MLMPALTGWRRRGEGHHPSSRTLYVNSRTFDAKSEPRDPRSQDADAAEGQDRHDLERLEIPEDAEIQHDDRADEHLEPEQELTLGEEIGLTGLPDDLGDIGHGFVRGQALDLQKRHDPKANPRERNQHADEQQRAAAHAHDLYATQVRRTRLASPLDALGVLSRQRRTRKQGRSSGARREYEFYRMSRGQAALK